MQLQCSRSWGYDYNLSAGSAGIDVGAPVGVATFNVNNSDIVGIIPDASSDIYLN